MESGQAKLPLSLKELDELENQIINDGDSDDSGLASGIEEGDNQDGVMVENQNEPEEEKKPKEKEEPGDEPVDRKKDTKKDDDDDDHNIYQEIAKITGFEPDEEFEDSIAGYAKYVERYGDHVAARIEESLKVNHPKAYAYLLHTINGGKDEEFFSSAVSQDYWSAELKEDDYDTQERIVKSSLKEQGWSDKRIARHIEVLKDDDALFEEASEIAEKKKEEVQRSTAEKVKQAEEIDHKNRELRQAMNKKLTETISSGEIKNWVIPKNDREKFAGFMRENIVFDGGKFYLRRELDPDKLSEELQGEYFKFKKGNLKDLIERTAKSVSVKKLKRESDSPRKTESKHETGSFVGIKDVW
jgi:hypothetical protein